MADSEQGGERKSNSNHRRSLKKKKKKSKNREKRSSSEEPSSSNVDAKQSDQLKTSSSPESGDKPPSDEKKESPFESSDSSDASGSSSSSAAQSTGSPSSPRVGGKKRRRRRKRTKSLSGSIDKKELSNLISEEKSPTTADGKKEVKSGQRSKSLSEPDVLFSSSKSPPAAIPLCVNMRGNLKALIVTEGTKTIKIDSNSSAEEEGEDKVFPSDVHASPKSDSSDSTRSCRSPILVTRDNRYRCTALGKPERLKVTRATLCNGWCKPVFKFHVNRLQETGRAAKMVTSQHMFPNVRRLVIEALHLPLSEKPTEDENAICYLVCLPAQPPPIASDKEKTDVLNECVLFLATVLRTFNQLIELYLRRRKEGVKKPANCLISEILCVVKNINVQHGDSGQSRLAESRLEMINEDLNKMTKLVELLEKYNVLQGDDDPFNTGSQEGCTDLWFRVSSSFQKCRQSIAALLLRLGSTCMANVELAAAQSPMTTEDLQECGFEIPISLVKHSTTAGGKGTNALVIETKDVDESAVAKTSSKFTYAKGSTNATEVLVHGNDAKELFYVYDDKKTKTVQARMPKNASAGREATVKLVTAQNENEENVLRTGTELDTANHDELSSSPLKTPKDDEQTSTKSIQMTLKALGRGKTKSLEDNEEMVESPSTSALRTREFLFPKYVPAEQSVSLKAPASTFEKVEKDNSHLVDIYKWAEMTRKKFNDLNDAKQLNKPQALDSFVKDQLQVNAKFGVDKAADEEASKVPRRKPDKWDALVAGWNRASVERWNRKGLHVEPLKKVDGGPDSLATAEQLSQRSRRDDDSSFYNWLREMVRKTLRK